MSFNSAQLCSGAGLVEIPIDDQLVGGQVDVAIGSPATQYSLIFDPGSSNTWVGANKAYVQTSSSQKTSDTVAVTYGSGGFSGDEYNDLASLNGVDFNQSIGVAKKTDGFQSTGADGILGLGPTGLTTGTLSPDTQESIPTVTDNLYSQSNIDSPIITITGTTITFGSATSAQVTYGSITTSSPANTFWGFDASISYGAASLQPASAGIIDHGTTLLLLATNSFNNFMSLSGATMDQSTGLPVLSGCTGLDSLDPIILTFAGVNITIPYGQYLWPREHNTAIGGSSSDCYLAIGDVGTDFNSFREGPGLRFRRSTDPNKNGNGINFIMGYNTLKHFTVVLDGVQSSIGMAN